MYVSKNQDEQAKLIQYYMDHALKEDDTFSFDCQMCGRCCRNRSEAITLTGADIFYIAKELGITPLKVMQKYTVWSIGPNSKMPIFSLFEKASGACALLHNSKCSVHKSKPVVCAIYPLGRILEKGGTSYTYFTQPKGSTCAGECTSVKHTLKEWLDEFQIQQRDKDTLAWHTLFGKVSSAALKAKSDEELALYQNLALRILYLDYDTSKEYSESIQENEASFDALCHAIAAEDI